MKILVTGAKGFVGRNLCENLKNLRDGKNRTRPALTVDEIYEYDLDTDPALLEVYPDKVSPLIVHIHASCATAGGHVAGGGLRAGKAFRSVRIFMIPLDGSPA